MWRGEEPGYEATQTHCTELLHTHTVTLCGLLRCMYESYQYSKRVAILHSLHMGSEHVVSQKLHSACKHAAKRNP